jgi:hypothetical protein
MVMMFAEIGGALSTEMPTSPGVQRGRIVDAVAQEAHRLTAAFRRQQTPQLLRRGNATEQIGARDPTEQRLIAHGREFIEGHDAFCKASGDIGE